MWLHGHHRFLLCWHWVKSLHSTKLENGDVNMSPEPPSTACLLKVRETANLFSETQVLHFLICSGAW